MSVVTPTWMRHQLLLERCIPSVQVQTWPEVEHIVVSDGPDDRLARILDGTPVVYAELPEHPTDEINVGAHARNHGLTLATGELIAYLDDDNAFRPDHLETLADALWGSDADFVYSRMLRHPGGDEVGSAPPRWGHIDSSIIMHRRGVPETFGLWPAGVYEVDWRLVEAWMAAGARWEFVPKVTVDYWSRG